MIVQFIRRNYSSVLTSVFLVACFLEAFTLFMDHVIHVNPDEAPFPTLLPILAICFLLALLLLYVMIFASRLRDEYVEKLWQRAARDFAILILILPWIWLFAWNIKSFVIPEVYWLPSDPKVAIIPLWGDDPNSVSSLQMSGISFVLGRFWTFCPLVFVALFKWHAWRDRA